jgi:hypothetical protein
MLTKTMNQILSKKVNHWLETITDEELRKEILNGLVITGGCFPSMIMNEEPKDYDCYFTTKELTLKVAEYYAKVWNDSHPEQKNRIGKVCKVMVLDGANPSQEIRDYYWNLRGQGSVEDMSETGAVMIDNCAPERVKMIFPSDGVVGDLDAVNSDEELGLSRTSTVQIVQELDEVKADEIIGKEKRPYFPVFISENAITLSDGIQIVVRFYGEPDKVHETYDFVHTKAYWTKKTQTVIPNQVYECVINKTLIYTGSLYPICSIFRLRKFIARGWKINVGQILKMCMQVSELNLQNINTLEEQLVGVDSLYFQQLINQFQKKRANDPSFVLSTDYVLSIIDKIF